MFSIKLSAKAIARVFVSVVILLVFGPSVLAQNADTGNTNSTSGDSPVLTNPQGTSGTTGVGNVGNNPTDCNNSGCNPNSNSGIGANSGFNPEQNPIQTTSSGAGATSSGNTTGPVNSSSGPSTSQVGNTTTGPSTATSAPVTTVSPTVSPSATGGDAAAISGSRSNASNRSDQNLSGTNTGRVSGTQTTSTGATTVPVTTGSVAQTTGSTTASPVTTLNQPTTNTTKVKVEATNELRPTSAGVARGGFRSKAPSGREAEIYCDVTSINQGIAAGVDEIKVQVLGHHDVHSDMAEQCRGLSVKTVNNTFDRINEDDSPSPAAAAAAIQQQAEKQKQEQGVIININGEQRRVVRSRG